jgi:hypothetical protein
LADNGEHDQANQAGATKEHDGRSHDELKSEVHQTAEPAGEADARLIAGQADEREDQPKYDQRREPGGFNLGDARQQ